jgi:hypothetical protein
VRPVQQPWREAACAVVDSRARVSRRLRC